MYLVIKMRKNENICKFVNIKFANNLDIHNFVYEKSAPDYDSFINPKYNTIYLVTNGKGKLITENNTKVLFSGNIFFTFKGVPFKISNADNITYMYITFDGERCEELFSRFGISPINCVFEGYEGLRSFWENSIIKASEKNLDIISESVLLYTLGEMAPPEKNSEQYLIGNILKFIDENFNDSNINLSSVAESFGYNCKYISRIFKISTGVTFSEYLTNTRIRHAVFLIEQNVTSIKNIALLCGYKDSLYFSNVFKSKLGMSPKKYIENKESKN